MGCLLLSLIPVADAVAGELETMRERYDDRLKAHEKRIAEIEAKGRDVSPDPTQRAERITRDRIAEIRASLKDGGGPAKSVAEQSESLDVVTREWGTDGTERKKLRDAIAALQKNLALAGTNLTSAAEVGGAMKLSVQQSGVLEKVVRIEGAASEARGRLNARWERERAAREREREQREREAAERARGVR